MRRMREEDLYAIWIYLRDKLAHPGDAFWPQDEPDVAAYLAAQREFEDLGPAVTADTLADFCARHLSDAQWRKLQAAIRQKRSMRKRNVKPRTVRLEWDAWYVLAKIAERDKLTLSGAVKRYLAPVLEGRGGEATE